MGGVGTKNLGLIKAIFVGVNPPLNTKVLWFNDSTLPYLTGPAKVHYYYDVIAAQWMPLLGNGGGGNYTYIAYSSACDGVADFSLNFNTFTHCFWSIITSPIALTPLALVPSLFVNKWTIFCKCDAEGNTGNFTYVMYADDCDGTNMSPDLKKEVDCSDCVRVNTFGAITGNSSFSSSSTGDTLTISLTSVSPGQTASVALQMPDGSPLIDLVDYVVEIVTLPTYSGQLNLNLGVSYSDINLNAPTTGHKYVLQNQGSILNITASPSQPPFTSEIQIKIGTTGCLAEEIDGHCFCDRKYFAIITSDTEIETLTPDLFADYWIPTGGCCGDGFNAEGAYEVIENQIININNNFNTYVLSNDAALEALQNSFNVLYTSSLKKYYEVVTAVKDIPLTIKHNLSLTNPKNFIIEASSDGESVIIKTLNYATNTVDILSNITMEKLEIKII